MNELRVNGINSLDDVIGLFDIGDLNKWFN